VVGRGTDSGVTVGSSAPEARVLSAPDEGPATDAPAPTGRLRPGAAAAVGFIVVTVVLLWAWHPVGVVLVGLSLLVLSPWGVTLGERAVVTTGVVLGSIAGVFSVMNATGRVLSPVEWRLVVTIALAAVAAGAVLRRRVPVWPRPSLVDALALAGGAGIAVLLGWSLLGATPARALGILMSRWDNTSHLSIFAMVFHAQSWQLTRLGPDPMLDPYPSLHAATWAVIEWLGGVSPTTSGAGLVVPFAWLSVGTMAWTGSLTVWAAALLARRAARPDRRGGAALVAAVATAAWAAWGALPVVGLYAWANFALATALAVGAVAVVLARPGSNVDTAWFALPLTALAIVYLYPPIAGTLAVAILVVLVQLARAHRRALAGMVLLGAVTAAAAFPALSMLVTPFHGEAAGTLLGGIPIKGVVVPATVAGVAAVGALFRHRRVGRGGSVLLVAAMAAPAATSWYFARQAWAADIPVASSYYTQKALLALLLVAVPVAVGLWAPTMAAWLTYRGTVGRVVLVRSVAAAALVAATVAIPFAGQMEKAGTRGPGWDAWTARQLAAAPVSRPDEVGRWVLAMAADQRTGATLTIGWHAKGFVPTRLSYLADPLKADRLAASLDHVASASVDPTYTLLGVAATAGLKAIRAYLVGHPDANLHVVVPNPASVQALAPLVAEFGPTRVQVVRS